MRRFLITIEYLGQNYNGFQAQKNTSQKTVQGHIEAALKEVFKTDIALVASGRLDSGVSALNLYAHFDTDSAIETKKILGAINRFLPSDIRVKNVAEVGEDFHARYSVKQKTYAYKMYISPVELPFLERDAARLYKQPDIKLMKKAVKYLLGTHDFSAFMSKNSSIKSTVRTIKYLKIKQKKNLIIIEICGDGFLYNMVRIIVGTLLDVGYKKIEPRDIKDILESRSRSNAGKMVEAKGLCLVDVDYGRTFSTIF